MRNLRIVVMLMLMCSGMLAIAQQGISVKSFTELSNDLDARVNYPITDQNGQKCALVKIVTEHMDFYFDNGMLGVTKVLPKPEQYELWVYMPPKTMKLKITHSRLGQLKDSEDGYYYFPSPLKEASCYRMELTTAKVTVLVEEERKKTGFLIINSRPTGADVYLMDGGEESYAGTTPMQKKLTYGSYNYRIKKSLYHDEVGVAVIDNTRVEQNIDLRPAFGSLKVTSNPSGARVVLQNDARSFTTPCTIDQIPSGKHQMQIVSPRYAPYSRVIEITDGTNTSVNATLDARFANVTINTLPGASISINGQTKGSSSYSENLDEGIYDIEVSLDNHRSANRQIEVVANQPQTITLKPTPIYGSLDIISEPMYANVTINGKSYGDTPLSIDPILIGTYDVLISKQGCASVTKRVTITEGASTTVEVTLPQGREMTIRSDAAGDEVYLDGAKIGVTPLATNLSFGSHVIELRRSGKSVQEEVNVTASGSEKEILLIFGLMPRWSSSVTSQQKAVLRKLIAGMVKVEGGTFTMGATSEQGSQADSDEKPTHQVTLSDYMIGKTEVTQEQWEAVMGSNPSRYKGSNLPVESVSWNECQEFIKKLNSLTGLSFRLPTEAEWEYAARGGAKSRGYKYSGSNDIDAVAWCYSKDSNSSKTHTVATKQANELGLYDMSGNVYEWCSDWSGDYSASHQTNPAGPSTGSIRVIRGGSWCSDVWFCQVSDRLSEDPSDSYYFLGLRLAL